MKIPLLLQLQKKHCDYILIQYYINLTHTKDEKSLFDDVDGHSLGFFGLPYQLSLFAYASPDYLCLVTHQETLIEGIANLYCNNAGVKYGITFTEADVKQLKSLIADCLEEFINIMLFAEK